MYLHLSKKKKILSRSIIGIFDMDTATEMKDTRAFLKSMQNDGRVISETGDIPKSFVLFEEKNEANGNKETFMALLKFSSSSVEKKVNYY